MFVRPGNRPHDDDILAGLGIELKAGFPLVDGTGLTSVPGVWAAGNVADPRAQVITAAGAGSAAAIAINADLVQEDVDRAVASSTYGASGDEGNGAYERGIRIRTISAVPNDAGPLSGADV